MKLRKSLALIVVFVIIALAFSTIAARSKKYNKLTKFLRENA